MYSVEEEEKQKSEERPDEEPNKEVVDDNENYKVDEDVEEKVKDDEMIKKEKIAWKEDDFETTEYDCSTDDDSFRMIYSSTDQVEILSRLCQNKNGVLWSRARMRIEMRLS